MHTIYACFQFSAYLSMSERIVRIRVFLYASEHTNTTNFVEHPPPPIRSHTQIVQYA